MKPFLVLQLRPETEASDDEYEAILDKGGLKPSETLRVRLDQESIPDHFKLENCSGVIVGGGPGCVSDADEKKSDTDRQIEDAVLDLMPEDYGNGFPFPGLLLWHRYSGPSPGRQRQQGAIWRRGWGC